MHIIGAFLCPPLDPPPAVADAIVPVWRRPRASGRGRDSDRHRRACPPRCGGFQVWRRSVLDIPAAAVVEVTRRFQPRRLGTFNLERLAAGAALGPCQSRP